MSINKTNRAFSVNEKSPFNENFKKSEISKNKNHNYILAGILTVAICAFAVFTGINSSGFETIAIAKENSQNVSQEKKVEENLTVKNISYSRPTAIGGPLGSVKINANPASEEERTVESRLREIAVSANPDSLPLIWAHMGKINNEYGFRRNPFGAGGYEFHGGMDIDGNKGDIIVAPGNGVISKAGWQGGYGNLIEIDHGNGLTTRYGHLSRIDAKVGDPVQRGQVIGLLGSTGRSTGPHLHYEIRVDDKTINPRKFLPPEMPR